MDFNWQSLRDIAQACWQNSEDKGWHEPDKALVDASSAILDNLEGLRDVPKEVAERFRDISTTLLTIAHAPPTMEKLALIMSEGAEAIEAYRNKDWDPSKTYAYAPEVFGYVTNLGLLDNPKPEGVGSELADVVIRVFDLAGILKIDIAEQIRIKMAYNATRKHRHGGKRA